MFVKERFKLSPYAISLINDLEPDFGYDGFGEFIFYRTYSRWNGEKQESWHDCVIRVIEGCMSIRKDWYIKNHISWVEKFWQEYALRMAISLFKMEWLAPGRGLWAMGTDFIYERGSMALNNCGVTELGEDFENDLGWLMDALMLGVGVGFSPTRNDKLRFSPRHEGTYDFEIPDSREGWVESVVRLISAMRYGTKRPRMIYDKVRPAGLLIRGFGGISSGPEPLMYLHEKIEELCGLYMDDPYYDSVMLKMDIANLIGCCVVAGNVRRSAELASLSIKDPVFKNLKNYEDPRYAYRAEWGWMSNNTVDLEDDTDFEHLGEIAESVKIRGEPGYKNLQNFPYGRIGKSVPVRLDKAKFLNPCQRGSSFVLTKNGIRQFNEIKENDQIWSQSGWVRVTKKWSTGVNKVYKYRTTAGYFEGTENHKVLCDYMKIPVCNAYAIDIITGPYKKNLEFNPQDVIDGLTIGDGTVKNGNVYLIMGVEDNYFTRELTPLIHRCADNDNLYEITTTLSIDEVPFTYLREFPERFLQGNRQKVCSFLRGLYSANGSICGNRITLKATSFKIIEQVQVMLNSIGIMSYYTTNKTKEVEFNNGFYQCKQSYDLNISIDREKFVESIGFIHEDKNSRLKTVIDNLYQSKYGHHSSKTTYDIISVELISEEETFDITVDNDSHTYWTAGCNVSNCGESKLENRELCNQSETLPTRCDNPETWLKACEYATTFSSTISLLPTHQPETNKVIARNRRITVSIIDYTGWKLEHGVNKVTKWMRIGYDTVTRVNQWANSEAGVPESIRKTTIKPGGTTPKLAGRTPGIGHPTFTHTLRRVIIAKNSPLVPLLKEANVPLEQKANDPGSLIVQWPIIQGPAKPAYEISLWEQAMNLVLVQREWADNAVSNTLYFRPKWVLIGLYQDTKTLTDFLSEKVDLYKVLAKIDSENEDFQVDKYRIKTNFDQETGKILEISLYIFDRNHEEDSIESVLSAIAPLTKSVSLLPHSPKGVYEQMPEEGISEQEYWIRKQSMRKIDWSKLTGSTGEDERYCQGDNCEIVPRA